MDAIPASCRGSGGNVRMRFSARNFLHWIFCTGDVGSLPETCDGLPIRSFFNRGRFLTGSFFVGGPLD